MQPGTLAFAAAITSCGLYPSAGWPSINKVQLADDQQGVPSSLGSIHLGKEISSTRSEYQELVVGDPLRDVVQIFASMLLAKIDHAWSAMYTAVEKGTSFLNSYKQKRLWPGASSTLITSR